MIKFKSTITTKIKGKHDCGDSMTQFELKKLKEFIRIVDAFFIKFFVQFARLISE